MSTLIRVAVLLIFGALLISWAPQAQADPLTIPAGDDLFQTVPGFPAANGTWVDLPPALPGGFFGVKSGTPSDPVILPPLTFLKGNPGALPDPPGPYAPFIPAPFSEAAALAQHGVVDNRNGLGLAGVDTIVQRGPASLPMIGSQDTIPIEIVALHLVSVQPITVTYGAEPVSFFDIFVTLNGVQTPGTMTLTRTGTTSGTFDSQLPVSFRIDFIGQSQSDPQAQQPFLGTDTFISQDSAWEMVPEPSTYILGLLGLAAFGLLAWRRRK